LVDLVDGTAAARAVPHSPAIRCQALRKAGQLEAISSRSSAAANTNIPEFHQVAALGEVARAVVEVRLLDELGERWTVPLTEVAVLGADPQ